MTDLAGSSRLRRVRALVAVIVLLVASCSSGSDADTTESTTSTTAAEDSESVESSTSGPSSAAPVTTTEPDAEPDSVYPLTGLPVGDRPKLTSPALVVKIGNDDANSRASLIGVEDADIVFEERIEGSATRFAAVFHSSVPEEIGSVRSGRTSDIDIVSNLSNPVFVYSGSNEGVAAQLRTAEDNGFLTRVTADTTASPFYRHPSFNDPYNLMVNGPEIVAASGDDAAPPSAIFDYSNNIVELGSPSAGVTVDALFPASFTWSDQDQGYSRFQDGTPHVTREGVQVLPTNVVVLTTTYVPSQIDRDSIDARTIGEGPVVIYSNGFMVEGRWTRSVARDPFTFTTPDGDIIGLAPGQTWVSLAPGGAARELSSTQADALR